MCTLPEGRMESHSQIAQALVVQLLSHPLRLNALLGIWTPIFYPDLGQRSVWREIAW